MFDPQVLRTLLDRHSDTLVRLGDWTGIDALESGMFRFLSLAVRVSKC